MFWLVVARGGSCVVLESTVKKHNLLSLSLVLHTYVFTLCRNHTGCNKHTLTACFSLSCNILHIFAE